uniref:Cytochrome P450 2J2 n=1 Tax=Calidris pygmaea TaxID=425635 RepID=A0A8C3JH48_9CHAR
INKYPYADATYDEENLIQTIFDLFLAGTETTATTLRWALLYMVVYPDIQAKVQKELDAVLGCSHAICYEDRKKLPYTNAVIHEIQRYSNIVLIALPRQSMKDTELLGFPIPKGTVCVWGSCWQGWSSSLSLPPCYGRLPSPCQKE